MKNNSKLVFLNCLVLALLLLPSKGMAIQEPTTCRCPNGEEIFVGTEPCGDVCGAGLVCQYVGMGETVCEEPEPDPGSEPDPGPKPDPEPEVGGAEITNAPVLEHFTLTGSSYTADGISLVFTPKGNSSFQPHISLQSQNGQNILETWCTGDQTFCRAVGSGRSCGDNPATGENAWCYGGAE